MNDTHTPDEYTELVADLIAKNISPAEARKRSFSAYWYRDTRKKTTVPAV